MAKFTPEQIAEIAKTAYEATKGDDGPPYEQLDKHTQGTLGDVATDIAFRGGAVTPYELAVADAALALLQAPEVPESEEAPPED